MLLWRGVGGQRWGARRFREAFYDSAGSFGSRARVLVVSASTICLHEQPTKTQNAFDNDDLLNLSPNRRGRALEAATRRILGGMYPRAVFEDAVPGSCVNGAPRSQHMAEYDWLMDGRRLECKSSLLSWRRGHQIRFLHRLWQAGGPSSMLLARRLLSATLMTVTKLTNCWRRSGPLFWQDDVR